MHATLLREQFALSGNSINVAVVSDVYGQRGGAYRVTSLLSKALADCGFNTTCFATWVDRDSLTGHENFTIVEPLVRRGFRWDLPNRVLASQVQHYVNKHEPAAVIVIGLTKLCGYLLCSRIAQKLFVWELTDAKPGNKFVYRRAAENLANCSQVLSPAATIDDSIRVTYGYRGTIARMPFWIEDEHVPFTREPDEIVADFLFLARREDDKGLRELVDATSILHKEFPKLTVVIAGPGDETPYRRLAEQRGVASSITFQFLPRRCDAMRVLASSRFLVLPSYHEGYPLSLLEAAQYSVPFVATDVGSIREVFGGCAGSRIVPPRDVTALAEAMKSQLLMTASDYVNARNSVYLRFMAIASESCVHKKLHHLIAGRALTQD